MNDEEEHPRKMLTIEEVLDLVPISKSTLFRKERKGTFPTGHMLARNRKFYFADEIVAWQKGLGKAGQQRSARPPTPGLQK